MHITHPAILMHIHEFAMNLLIIVNAGSDHDLWSYVLSVYYKYNVKFFFSGVFNCFYLNTGTGGEQQDSIGY